MRVFIICFGLFVSALATAGEDAWYSGGTLHDATLTEWINSSYKNKTATSADFAMSFDDIKKLVVESGNMGLLKLPAVDIAICVDEVARSENMENLSVKETAASCGILMGYK